ncbi:hypothetical protein OKA04_23655 [Luteolibacter flavescens]|uniref:Transmembrane protein n=1 Tax=Luteolibacter flavescens TaxID=1859460 RepID=A0ABT3FW04_9BACT|nr:hypothetical protein [Luteolibacter flavescens]MCW1887754.1 hypothetical protein [Luteolibacter flavescens]
MSETSEPYHPPLPRKLALFAAAIIVLAAVLTGWRFSPAKEAAFYFFYYACVAAASSCVALYLAVTVYFIRRMPAWTVVLAGLIGAGVVCVAATYVDFREEISDFRASDGRRASLIIDDSDDVGVDLIFRVEQPDGSLAAEESLHTPIALTSQEVKQWALHLREHDGQLQVATAGGKLVAWHSTATGRINTLDFTEKEDL